MVQTHMIDGSRPQGAQSAPACCLVIFGAAGDLTKRLVVPALYNLAGSNLLDARLEIIGVDHTGNSDKGWSDMLGAEMQSFVADPSAEFHPSKIDQPTWQRIADRMSYVQGDFTDSSLYETLTRRLSGNVVFYLAVAARFFGIIVEKLGEHKLLDQTDAAFRRVIIEKPFGSDLPTARALNQQILRVADESQLFRIDHFLGKETVQSLMAIRFANGIFEPLWKREYIEYVEITAAETIGVEQRGSFYEPTGALRDMVPNHLFQLLSVIAMEPPSSFSAEAVRNEKAKLIESIAPIQPRDAVRGQYTAGQVQDQRVVGYRTEPNVSPDSTTETYVAARLRIENWRWAGVPFYLRSGKRMSGRMTEIAIHFRAAPYQLFSEDDSHAPARNVVRLPIEPQAGSMTQFNVKTPGPKMKLTQVATSFAYASFFDEKPTVGYETLLYDCMMGDATLFQRADSIEASWAAVQPLLDCWYGANPPPPKAYAAGTAGPAAADDLLAEAQHHWTSLTAETHLPGSSRGS